jgi:gluconolactonase
MNSRLHSIAGCRVRGQRFVVLLPILLLAAAAGARGDAGIIAPGAAIEKLAGEYAFTEGPVSDREGNVFFSDQPNDRIVKWSAADGSVADWLKPAGRSNGLYFDRAGNLIACADENNQLWSIAPDKKVTVLVRDLAGKLLNGPNDVWVHPKGGIYFTDPLYKRAYWQRDPKPQQAGQHVYYMSAPDAVPVAVATDLEQPNGIIGTPDGKQLYVADIRAKKTYAFDIAPDGRLGGKRLFCEMGSDGMTLDAQGNVYLTGKGVTVFNSKGERIQHIEVPEPWTANITFGGKDRKLLFITASKGIYGLKMAVAGISPFE